MGGIFGGGGGGGGSSSGTQVQIAREAPEVESRKLALYDEAVKLAQQPITLPQYQVAAPTGLQQSAFQAAGTTGVGQGAVGQGIASLQAGAAPIGSADISRYFNPYQSYVTDEIARQGQIQQNQLAGQAVQAGAFGGGREGVQQAEIQRATQANIGQAQAARFSKCSTNSGSTTASTISWRTSITRSRCTTTSNATRRYPKYDSSWWYPTTISTTSFRCCKTISITTSI
jgi:hypothetical protein